MKSTSYGRIVFGIFTALFGAICLMWHDFDTWQSIFRILSLPFGAVVGDVLMVALIAGGLFLLVPVAVRAGARILIALFAIFAIACVVGIFSHPKMFAEYDTLLEQVSMLSGALAIAATAESVSSRAAMLNLVARIGYGLSLVSFMLAQIIYYGDTAPLVPKWLPPNEAFWAWATTVAFGLAAVAVLLDIRARLALGLTALMLAMFGLIVWVPALIAHPTHNNWSEFSLNAIIGAAAWVTMNAAGSGRRARSA
ncbi:MAG TPA: hypothetical protein VGF18_00775 [Candidatus Tumulicola sp.]|jgi:hypothetical protein